MCVEARLREVAVVGLVIHLQCQVAIGVEQVLQVEVADERRVGLCHVVPIAELSVEQQSVIEHTSVHDALIFGIVPAFVAC